ncbi:MAG TPA: hypothetical protein VGM77_06345 [Gemmatimonadales bacterium]|jgi:hypothetical protein
MRRLWLLVLLLAGAASVASAQARTHIGARLQLQSDGPPALVFSVSNLLDDGDWLSALNNASRIELHWSVSLSRSRAIFDVTGTPTEWNDYVEKIPTLDVFNYMEPSRGRLTTRAFNSLDSLKLLLGQEQQINTPRTLAPGRWYYSVQLTVTADDRPDPNSKAQPLSAFQRLILGNGLSRTYGPQTTVTFVVPERQ